MTDKQVEAFANSRMTFGRNVGEKIADISFGYLIWLAEEKMNSNRICGDISSIRRCSRSSPVLR